MINELIDAQRTDADPAEALRPACLLSLHELVTTHANYERRLHHDLVWGEDSFTDEERAHALDVERAYGEFKASIRYTIQSHRY